MRISSNVYSPTGGGDQTLSNFPKFQIYFHGSPHNIQTSFHGSPQTFKQSFTGVNGVPVIQTTTHQTRVNLEIQIF